MKDIMRYILIVLLATQICLYAQSNWIEQNSSTSSSLKSVHFNDSQNGWVVGEQGTVLKTTDGGNTWNEVGGIANSKLFSVVFFIDNSTGWTVGELGSIYKTTDGGSNWFSQSSPSNRWLRSIYFVNSDVAFICGDRGTILKTIDGGTNWTALNSTTIENLYSIHFEDINIGWTVGEYGTILKTTDGGASWAAQDVITYQNFNSVFFINSSTGWIAGTSGKILHTIDGGISWMQQLTATSQDFSDINFSDNNNGIAVGDNGIIYSTSDGGSNWSPEETPVNVNLKSGIIINSNNCWVVGDNGTILRKSIGIAVEPEEVIVTSHDPVQIDVNIQSVSNLFGVSLTIEYDDTILKCDSIKQGNFLKNNPGNNSVVFEYFPKDNVRDDSVIVDQAILGTEPVSGSGRLVSLFFTALSGGISEIRITGVNLKDNYNQPISSNTKDGIVTVQTPSVSAKVFLEGPYAGGNMTSYLNFAALLPVDQPYSGAPWFYEGTESVTEDFFSENPRIVDWVLLELRTGVGSDTKVAERAAFLNHDGVIVDLDGVSPVSFFVPSGSQEYYLVVKHRNHLPVMSALPFQINEYTPLYNFTNAANKSYGNGSVIEFADGNFGMYAGDANGNGQVQNNDSESFWRPQNGLSGYQQSDFNLNGQVQNNDRESYWRKNNGIGSKVPD